LELLQYVWQYWYTKKIEPEHKSVLIEIIVMIVETILISIVVWINSWDSVLQTTLVVLFVETAVYTINLFSMKTFS
jgi:hypothetical protein